MRERTNLLLTFYYQQLVPQNRSYSRTDRTDHTDRKVEVRIFIFAQDFANFEQPDHRPPTADSRLLTANRPRRGLVSSEQRGGGKINAKWVMRQGEPSNAVSIQACTTGTVYCCTCRSEQEDKRVSLAWGLVIAFLPWQTLEVWLQPILILEVWLQPILILEVWLQPSDPVEVWLQHFLKILFR